MTIRTDRTEIEIQKPGARETAGTRWADGAARAPYAPPRLERLGAWSALTLQQSVPIFP